MQQKSERERKWNNPISSRKSSIITGMFFQQENPYWNSLFLKKENFNIWAILVQILDHSYKAIIILVIVTSHLIFSLCIWRNQL